MSNRFLAEVKKNFFDRQKVKRVLDRRTIKILAKFGGIVRKTAQFSMRSRKGKSSPGQPPYAHGKKLLRKLIFFSVNPIKKTVVIGPILKDSTENLKITRLHEVGGTLLSKHKGKVITQKYPKRPSMVPAFKQHVGKVASLYRSV